VVNDLHTFLEQHELSGGRGTWIPMTKMDWKRRLIAKPVVSQKKTRRMLEMRRMAQTIMEKEPRDFYLRMRASCE
jgi:hypothetical protein